MQYLARGRYGEGLPLGAGAKLLKTNSGLSIEPRCSRNDAFHGAGCGEAGLEVEAMVRPNVRLSKVTREAAWEAMIAGCWRSI